MNGQLEESQVKLLYRELLGREASRGDIDHHLSQSRTLSRFLEVLVSSEEYLARSGQSNDVQQPQLYANLWHPDLDQWTHPAGTISADKVAIVGREGWIFIRGGSNQYVPQFTGELQMEPDWLGRWEALIATREDEAASLGVELKFFVVPEKVAIMIEHYPEALVSAGPRPIERLVSAGLPIHYPLRELRRAAANKQVCLRTDSHLTLEGNAVLHADLLADLGAIPIDVHRLSESHLYLASGDLGSRFTPQILEITAGTVSLGSAQLVDDNWDIINQTGGHIGTRRVFVTPDAPDPRTVILFGDSYGFAATNYQGTAWFLAQIFRETHFVWAPFGWDPGYVKESGAEVVISETAERFLARVPLERVKVEELTARASTAGTFVDVDEIFADSSLDAELK